MLGICINNPYEIREQAFGDPRPFVRIFPLLPAVDSDCKRDAYFYLVLYDREGRRENMMIEPA